MIVTIVIVIDRSPNIFHVFIFMFKNSPLTLAQDTNGINSTS